jgi:hypothetical protein
MERAGYRAELIGAGLGAKVALCNSLEELGSILRESGIGKPGVAGIFRRLEASADVEVML